MDNFEDLQNHIPNPEPLRECGVVQYHEYLLQTDPNYQLNRSEIEDYTQKFIQNYKSNLKTLDPNQVITIPVVFHVVYNTTTQNIADSKLIAQINQLNLDFSATNPDNLNTPAIFEPTGNMNIQFCLASRDPLGNSTTGIERRQTSVTSFTTNDSVKFFSSGGLDAWPNTSYLNLWVCNISGNILGYAAFPGSSAAVDGVVLRYTTIGSVATPSGFGGAYSYGRTATHEIGHWLNLRHIWGDAFCGNDFVSDTPLHNTSNFGCPAYPHYSTCSGTPIEMTMNYMDYTNDLCMYMFSIGQTLRARALFDTTGFRVQLLNSLGCVSPNVNPTVTPTSTTTPTTTPTNTSTKTQTPTTTQTPTKTPTQTPTITSTKTQTPTQTQTPTPTPTVGTIPNPTVTPTTTPTTTPTNTTTPTSTPTITNTPTKTSTNTITLTSTPTNTNTQTTTKTKTPTQTKTSTQTPSITTTPTYTPTTTPTYTPTSVSISAQVDFICVNWNNGVNSISFYAFISNLYNIYNKPIWILDLSPQSPESAITNPNLYTEQDIITFINQVVPWLNSSSLVEKYAWGNTSIGTCAIFDNQGQLTQVGIAYKNA